jgi:hypothetical protein
MKPHHVKESRNKKIAQKVIDQSKSSARVDTGALRRSRFTYIRGVVTLDSLFTVNLEITQTRKKRID